MMRKMKAESLPELVTMAVRLGLPSGLNTEARGDRCRILDEY